jgi:hypothetical protein
VLLLIVLNLVLTLPLVEALLVRGPAAATPAATPSRAPGGGSGGGSGGSGGSGVEEADQPVGEAAWVWWLAVELLFSAAQVGTYPPTRSFSYWHFPQPTYLPALLFSSPRGAAPGAAGQALAAAADGVEPWQLGGGARPPRAPLPAGGSPDSPLLIFPLLSS